MGYELGSDLLAQGLQAFIVADFSQKPFLMGFMGFGVWGQVSPVPELRSFPTTCQEQ